MLETGRLSQILGLSLIGMVLGRAGYFSDAGRFKGSRYGGLAVAVIALAIMSQWGDGIAALVPAAARPTHQTTRVPFRIPSQGFAENRSGAW